MYSTVLGSIGEKGIESPVYVAIVVIVVTGMIYYITMINKLE